MQQELGARIGRGLTGPPEATLDNPTVWLLCGLLALLAASTALGLAGALPLAAAALANTAAIYGLYTVNHEAAHGLAHRSRRANDWMGRVAAFAQLTTHPIFRLTHLQHHAWTNDPERDPDAIVGRQPRWLYPWWLARRLAQDNAWAARRGLFAGQPRALAEHRATLVLQLAGLAAALGIGHLREALALFVLPAVLSAAALFTVVAFAVHRPHASRHPLENSRNYRGRLFRLLSLNQSLHLVHHLSMRVPWYRYADALPEVDRALARHAGERAAAERDRPV